MKCKDSNEFDTNDVRARHTAWDDEANVLYRGAVQAVVEALENAFPVALDISQRKQEPVLKYLARFTTIHESHSHLKHRR